MAITFLSNLTVSGGGITLEGTGRIQGVDTVTANTDAANKLYVDNSVPTVSTTCCNRCNSCTWTCSCAY